MIIDIPTEGDFNSAGVEFINLGVDHIFTLYDDYRISAIEKWGDNDDIASYWKLAQRRLLNALTLVQQGVDFLLKSRIVNVSPYLLISGDPRDWPRNCDSREVSFSEFRSIDAQDLVRLHETVCPNRLSKLFKMRFEELRHRRNTIMHTIDQSFEIDVRAILLYSLEAIHEIIGPFNWMVLRKEYLQKMCSLKAYKDDDEYVKYEMVVEFKNMIDMLGTRDLNKYFGFNKKQRRYICPFCVDGDSFDYMFPKIALLNPNTPSSTNIYCFVCKKNIEVIREKCSQQDCKGNVIYKDEMTCLTCFSSNDEANTI